MLAFVSLVSSFLQLTHEVHLIIHLEPELWRGYDPKKKVFNQEVELVHDLEAFEVAEADAEKFEKEHGDIWAGEGDNGPVAAWLVYLTFVWFSLLNDT